MFYTNVTSEVAYSSKPYICPWQRAGQQNNIYSEFVFELISINEKHKIENLKSNRQHKHIEAMLTQNGREQSSQQEINK